MIEITPENYNLYLMRFIAAETTVEEERALMEWIKRPDIPAEAAKDREMFGLYEELCSAPSLTQTEKDTMLPHPPRILRLWRHIASAAAVVAVAVAGAAAYFIYDYGKIPDEYLAYEGSYIIRDGKRITDLRIVVPELERRERELNERLRQLDRSVSNAELSTNSALLQTTLTQF